PVAVGVAIALVLVLAALAIGKPRLPTKSRLLLAGLTLLALSLDLFLSLHPALACVSGAAGAVVLLRGGWLSLPTARPASPVLALFPVVLGAALRFFSLEQFPGGFSEHAVVHH